MMTTISAVAKRMGVAAGLALAQAAAADAAVITRTYDGAFDWLTTTAVGNSSGSAALGGGPLAGELAFALFDPALGTLTGVDITVTGALATTYSVGRDNRGPAGTQAVSGWIGRLVTLALAPGYGLAADADMDFDAFALSLAKNQAGPGGELDDVLSNAGWSFGGNDVERFVGSGELAVNVLGWLAQGLFGPNGTTLDTASSWAGHATITYIYDPAGTPGDAADPPARAVPEPSALLLTGIGLLGLALPRAKRQPL